MDQDAAGMARIMAVAGEVRPAIDDKNLPAEDAHRSLGHYTARRTGAADEQIDVVQHGGLHAESGRGKRDSNSLGAGQSR